ATAAQGFYNDTWLLDQNACTAPQLVYWLGEGDALAAAQVRFWEAVLAYAAPRYPIDPLAAVDKLTALYRAALTLPGARLVPMPDNLAVRIRLDALTPEVTAFHGTGGCFLEYASDSLAALAPLLTPKTQTISVLGVDPLAVRDFVLSCGARGVDRVVPVGHTLDFSLMWDGYDLIRTLSRAIATA
ncbi:MAG: acyl-CoA reductase, partial [Eubacteriales bacterium]|nr:acyl-CoA reductase [Eubacteriales bacterium]